MGRILIVSFCLLIFASGAHAAKPRKCGVLTPEGAGVGQVVAGGGVSCATALTVADEWQQRARTRIGRWTCRSQRLGYEYFRMRCSTSKKAVIWFYFGA